MNNKLFVSSIALFDVALTFIFTMMLIVNA